MSPGKKAPSAKPHPKNSIPDLPVLLPALLNTSIDLVLLLDTNLNLVWLNQTAINALKKPPKSPEAVIGHKCYQVFAGADHICNGCPCNHAMATGTIGTGILKYPSEEELCSSFWEHRVVPIKNAQGEITHLAVTAKNVTAVLQLTQSSTQNSQCRSLITTISTDFINLTPAEIDSGINDALRKIAEFAGADRAYVFQFSELGNSFSNTHEWCAPGVTPHIHDLQQLSVETFPWFLKKLLKKNPLFIPDVLAMPSEAATEKQIFLFQDIKSLLNIPMIQGNKVIGFLGFDYTKEKKQLPDDVKDLLTITANIFSNVLDRQRRAIKLLKNEERLNLAMDATRLGLWDLNLKSGSGFIDERGAALLGYSQDDLDPTIETWKELIHPADKNIVLKALTDHLQGKVPYFETEMRLRTKSDTWKWLFTRGKVVEHDKHGQPLRLTGTHLDITKQKENERNLRVAQKMEAIGTLAAGIAHNFNNVLTAILGYAKLSLYKTPKESDIHANLEAIVHAGKRAAGLVNQILTFSRQAEHDLKPLPLQPILKESLKMLRETFPTNIEIKQEIADDCGLVLADISQVHQVIMNICTNSFAAMRDTGGVLTVSLKQSDVIADPTGHKLDLPTGRYAHLVISDTGHGMDKKTMSRIFEPYFTTKKPDEGTGLGLATVQTIITTYGGAVTVDSQAGKGTTMNVYIPIVGETQVDKPEGNANFLRKGLNKSILFVDDEEMLARLGELVLQQIGCRATTFTDSKKALSAFRQKPDSFDMAILDQTMPGLMGLDLARKILEIRSDIPIVLCSGFNETINRIEAENLKVGAFLTKPFTIENLTETVWNILEPSKKDNPNKN